MGDITSHFSYKEFEHSNYAVRHSLDNSIPQKYKSSVQRLCEDVLEPIRDHWGSVTISSGYRGVNLNSAIGGSKTSQHCRGEAADLQFKSKHDLKEIFEWIKENIDYDQVIYEFDAWIHISCADKNRKIALIAEKVKGKTRYKQG